jgi:hypothetical protein
MFECARPELRVLANSDSEMQSFESCRLNRPVSLLRIRNRVALEMPLAAAQTRREIRAARQFEPVNFKRSATP